MRIRSLIGSTPNLFQTKTYEEVKAMRNQQKWVKIVVWATVSMMVLTLFAGVISLGLS